MRILFVHDHRFRKVGEKYYSTGGLSNKVLERYTRYADEVVIVARVVNADSVANRWSEITDEKVKIVGNSSLYCRELRNAIVQCDKMIVRLPSILGIQALYENNRVNKPCLIEMVACVWDGLWNHGIQGKICAPVLFYLNKRFIKKTHNVLYVTKEFLQKRYPTNGKSIGCSDVELPFVNKQDILQKRIEKIRSKKEYFVIGTIGATNVKYKGQQYVIKALGNLKKQGITKFKYELVGNGDTSYLSNLVKKYGLEDQVTFVGGVPNEKIFEWLDSIDIYVQPSRQEGLPRALVEAMSRGVFAFGAKVGGIPELLEEKHLFSTSHKNIKEIERILKNIKEKDLLMAAEKNIEKSTEYAADKLALRRNKFYEDFYG